MNLMEMKLWAARGEAVYNAQLMAAFEKHDAAKVALRQAKRYAKQCEMDVRAAIADKNKAVIAAKALGVSIAGDEESGAKVGAGGTAASGAARKPLLQAVRDGDFEAPEGGQTDIKETSAWLFEMWESAIKRDREAIANERAVRKARLEVFLALFKQVDVSFDGFRVKFFGSPLIDAYKSLRAIHELSPHVVECFFKDHDLAALSVCVETMTTPTGELHATFNPSVALVEFIAAHRADNGD